LLPAKPLLLTLPTWANDKEFVYMLKYYRKEALEPIEDPTFGFRLFKLATFFSNREIQQYSVKTIILPHITSKNMREVLLSVRQILAEHNNNEEVINLYNTCVNTSAKLILSQYYTNQSFIITREELECDENLINDLFEAIYKNTKQEYISQLINQHMKFVNENNIVVLFAKMLKSTLDKALKVVRAGSLPIEWNAQVNHKSQTLEQGGENFHLVLNKDNKLSKYLLFLVVGKGTDQKEKNTLSKSMESHVRLRSPVEVSSAGKRNFSGYFGSSSIFSNRNQSVSKKLNAFTTKHTTEKEIKLSQEATNIIKLTERFSTKQCKGKTICLINYIQIGNKDTEAKMNIHYLNTTDKKVLIKEQDIKNKRSLQVRANIFHSFTVSRLLQCIQEEFEKSLVQDYVDSLSQHQLIFLMHNARRSNVSEDFLADVVLKWCTMNIDKLPLDSLLTLLKKVVWKNVTGNKLGEIRSRVVDKRIVKLLPEIFIIPPIFSPAANSEDSRTNGSSALKIGSREVALGKTVKVPSFLSDDSVN
jgi:phosphopantetheinyl transferase (holo-ACP synthase)